MQLCLRGAPEFAELEHGVPIPCGIFHADPFVEFLGHLTFPETVRRVQAHASDDLNLLGFHRAGAGMRSLSSAFGASSSSTA